MLWLLNRPRATKLPAWLTRSTSSPSAGSPSTRAMAPAKTQGCRPKNGPGRRRRMTRDHGAARRRSMPSRQASASGDCHSLALAGYVLARLPLDVASVRSSSLALLPAVEQRPDPAEQLDLVDRLGEEVVGAGLDAALEVAGLVQGGDHQDGDVLRRRVGPEPLADLEAAELRHHHVEQDQVGLAAPRPRAGSPRRRRRSAIS